MDLLETLEDDNEEIGRKIGVEGDGRLWLKLFLNIAYAFHLCNVYTDKMTSVQHFQGSKK